MFTPPLIPMIWKIRQVLVLAAVEGGSATANYPTHTHTYLYSHTLTDAHTYRVTMTNTVALGRHRPGSEVSSVSINREPCDWLCSDSKHYCSAL